MPRLNLSEEETKALILREAYRLFEDIGYNKTTVADIAKACGFSPANVHKYFGAKSAINQAIATMVFAELLDAATKAIAAQETAADKFRAMVISVNTGTLERYRNRSKVYEMCAAALEGKWEAIREYRLSLREMVRDIIAYGCARGEFRPVDPDETAQAIHMALMRLFHPINIVDMIGEPDGGGADLLVDFILSALMAPSHVREV